ncbi:MAG TPA: c-type cytochrome [Gammaproteobacteria bacterium]|nr:c-type cytochrome [Gammaproteobacteria bacterium]
MREIVRDGKENTAMMSFSHVLTEQEIEAVIFFVRRAFMSEKQKNTRYHTKANGWANHERYRLAFPFALGDIALDTAWEDLTPAQRQGKQLYLSSCVSCHDRAKVKEEGVIWQSRPISWPRNGYSHQLSEKLDAVSEASPYALHDSALDYKPQTPAEKQGQALFQANCAFCHGADGTGKNWIGQFIEPAPRNFTLTPIQKLFSKKQLENRIKNGVEGTAMPAWRYVLTDSEIDSLVSFLWHRFN